MASPYPRGYTGPCMKDLLNKKALDFTLPDQDGKKHKLSQYRGQSVLLYFYPKDMTPGCTIEAEGFRDRSKEFAKAGIVVLGVSPDSSESHRKFCDKHGLSFALLADVGHKVAEKYGVWVEKSMYGRKYWGVERDSFLIDKEGNVVALYQKVKPEEHPDEILADAKRLKLAR